MPRTCTICHHDQLADIEKRSSIDGRRGYGDGPDDNATGTPQARRWDADRPEDDAA